ncbi:MAG TPA: hypothetical protein VGB70_02525 [Allosphingosinicella sp.]|jgi:hypothetical protein
MHSSRLLLLLAPFGWPAPAFAQGAEPPVLAAPAVVVPCDRSGNAIVVCGNPDAPEPYRLPPRADPGFDPWGGIDSVSRERHKLLGTGPAGIGSCTTVGPGGWTGCDIQVINQAEQQGKRVGIGTSRASIGLQVGRKKVGYGIP